MVNKITQKETIEMAKEIINRLMDEIEALNHDHYSGSDTILYADDWLKLVDNEIEDNEWEEFIKNLRLFTETI